MYDDIRFHFDEDYPAGLPAENAATHMGMFWAWAASQGLANPVWQSAPETASDFAAMRQGIITGAQFLLIHMGGALTPDDFTDTGRRFADFYYDDEEDGYGNFMSDYVYTLNTPENGGFYAVPDTAETYARLAPVFQTAFDDWRAGLK